MLEKKLNKQVTIAGWELGLGIGMLIGNIILMSILWGNSHFFVWYSIGMTVLFTCGIARFVLWIIGIVNAVSINGITDNSSILIVFSVLTFCFGHLIVAVSQKNKFLKNRIGIENETSNISPKSSFERKLKQSFIDGIISSSEYEQKLREYKDKQ